MPNHLLCKKAVDSLRDADDSLYHTLQNASEFWNVSTRPLDRNGHGLSAAQAALSWGVVETMMILLPDDARVYEIWRDLVVRHDVRGIQVHDAKLAAAMLAHSVNRILTLNVADFVRYLGIEAVHPSAV